MTRRCSSATGENYMENSCYKYEHNNNIIHMWAKDVLITITISLINGQGNGINV